MAPMFDVTIIGNVNACRTEAEVSLLSDDGHESELVALVFEDGHGVQTELFGTGLAAPRPAALDEAIAEAKDSLVHYVNRRGENPPEGLTRAGLSLWLLTKDDGTAMGQPVDW